MNLTHQPRCPALPASGSAGPCLCIPAREHAPAWVPTTRLAVDMTGTARVNGKAPSKNRHIQDHHIEVREANQRLRAHGHRWADVIRWATDTGHPEAGGLRASVIRPLIVDQFLAAGIPAGHGQ